MHCICPLSSHKYFNIKINIIAGRKTEMYSLFMYLGEFFKGLHNSWLWLAYEMYKLAIDAIQGYRVDLGYGEALARYVLGKFCFEKSKIKTHLHIFILLLISV